MKIEIDLKDVLQDEYGDTENIANSIIRQVSNELIRNYGKEVRKSIDEQISSLVKEQIKLSIEKAINDGLSLEYEVFDNYGSSKGKTTLIEQIRSAVRNASTYKNGAYSSGRNPFTETVNKIVSDLAKESQSEVIKTIDVHFKKKVLDDAVKHIKDTLKL